MNSFDKRFKFYLSYVVVTSIFFLCICSLQKVVPASFLCDTCLLFTVKYYPYMPLHCTAIGSVDGRVEFGKWSKRNDHSDMQSQCHKFAMWFSRHIYIFVGAYNYDSHVFYNHYLNMPVFLSPSLVQVQISQGKRLKEKLEPFHLYTMRSSSLAYPSVWLMSCKEGISLLGVNSFCLLEIHTAIPYIKCSMTHIPYIFLT